MIRIFVTKPFARFARREGIEDALLRDAVRRADQGLINADLGGGVVKQRIARPGQGRSSGYRSILLFRTRHRAFFAHGFAKNARDSIGKDELAAFRALAVEMLDLSEDAIAAAVANGTISEINDDD